MTRHPYNASLSFACIRALRTLYGSGTCMYRRRDADVFCIQVYGILFLPEEAMGTYFFRAAPQGRAT